MRIDHTAPRRTGKTTRLLLRAVLNVSLGRRVLVLCLSRAAARSLESRYADLEELLGIDCTQEEYEGSILFCAFADLYSVRGQTINLVLPDGGELEQHEKEFLAPLIPSQHYSENPWIQSTYPTAKLPDDIVDVEFTETPKEPRARRVLSSR